VIHPREVLLESRFKHGLIPVCDHYCGVEPRMTKSLALQRELIQEMGACVMDVTLDCEDGAPVGGELAHAQTVLALALEAQAAAKKTSLAVAPRIAVRVHALDHPTFEQDLACLLGKGSDQFCHVMLPKVESLADVQRAVAAVNATGATEIPLHVLIESAHAISQVMAIASHPRVESLSFGLMDFVSSHGGAIPASAMQMPGQFQHPMVVRAKLEIAAACHAQGKVASHCVVTTFNDPAAVLSAAQHAAAQLGFTRMWSIHPNQVRPIIAAFAPDSAELAVAERVMDAAMAANWGPVSIDGALHDRASFRYFWQLIERAHATGVNLSPSMTALCASKSHVQ
jgi:citrate lyase subunit beta / citryl-CoA lyase